MIVGDGGLELIVSQREWWTGAMVPRREGYSGTREVRGDGCPAQRYTLPKRSVTLSGAMMIRHRGLRSLVQCECDGGPAQR